MDAPRLEPMDSPLIRTRPITPELVRKAQHQNELRKPQQFAKVQKLDDKIYKVTSTDILKPEAKNEKRKTFT